MHDYAGDPATYPVSVPLVDDADLNPATGAVLDATGQALADRTANTNARALLLSLDGVHYVVPFGKAIKIAGATLTNVDDVTCLIDPGAGILTVVLGALSSIRAIAGGAIQLMAADTLQALVADAIDLEAAPALRSMVPGGIQLAGGPTDWVTFSPLRARSVRLDPPGYQLQGAPGATLQCQIPSVHNGATLSTVSVRFIVAGPHATTPAVMPRIQVQRSALAVGPVVTADNITGGFVPFTRPATGPLWDSSSDIQNFDVACLAPKNVMDSAQYTYNIEIVEESGAGAVGNNIYLGFILNYTEIADMRFP